MSLPKHIVIVEDEVITQRYLHDILSQHDVTVSACFSNAKDTLERIQNIECDMILMDINILGPMDGIQLAKKILNERHVPIVFITAHNDDETLDELLELAPYGFIAKPFSAKDVVINIQIAYKRYLTFVQVSSETQKEAFNDVTINERYRYSRELSQLFDGEDVVKLNQKQTVLVEILVENINHTVCADILESRVWGNSKIADSALRTLVYTLRKSLPDLPIVSYSKMGYMLSQTKEDKDD
jgi:DNA-binding response OmpR family regulator